MKNVLQIIPPNILCQLSGVWRVQRAHDLVTLEYTDGEREAAIIPLKEWSKIHTDFLRIVSAVQAQRRIAT